MVSFSWDSPKKRKLVKIQVPGELVILGASPSRVGARNKRQRYYSTPLVDTDKGLGQGFLSCLTFWPPTKESVQPEIWGLGLAWASERASKTLLRHAAIQSFESSSAPLAVLEKTSEWRVSLLSGGLTATKPGRTVNRNRTPRFETYSW